MAEALTYRYDPVFSEDALQRFTEFLTVRIPGKRDDRGRTVPELVGEQRYRDAVERLWPQLIACTFDESAPAGWFGNADRPATPFAPESRRRVLPKYFSDRKELLGVLRGLTDTLFGGAAEDAGKETWCEKTPFNLLYMDFLWELVPEATIVHIKRHPVSVVASFVEQPWAPPTVDGALAYLKPIYTRWLSWSSTANLADRRYIEVKAEDLADDWPGQRSALFKGIGVDDHVTPSAFQSVKLTNRDGYFDRGTRAAIERDLGDIISAMGYA